MIPHLSRIGYEKGEFTGAAERRKGKIEVADGGTLFLDEVGELTMPMQPALNSMSVNL